jgi:hypothetical protein
MAAVPLPSLAGEPTQPVARPGIRASAATIAATATLADTSAQAQAPSDGKASLNSPSFFKRPAGIAVLAVVFAGAGYAIYSASHDRIHSVVRQNQ